MSLKQEYRRQHWYTRGARRLVYLVQFSDTHGLDPFELLRAFFRAMNDGAVLCGPFKITLRKRTRDQSTFLVTRGSKILAQLKLGNTFWEDPYGTKTFFSVLIDRARS